MRHINPILVAAAFVVTFAVAHMDRLVLGNPNFGWNADQVICFALLQLAVALAWTMNVLVAQSNAYAARVAHEEATCFAHIRAHERPQPYYTLEPVLELGQDLYVVRFRANHSAIGQYPTFAQASAYQQELTSRGLPAYIECYQKAA